MRTACSCSGRTMDVMIEANESLQLQTIRRGRAHRRGNGRHRHRRFRTRRRSHSARRGRSPKYASQLQRFAVPAEQYAAWRSRVTSGPNVEFRRSPTSSSVDSTVSIPRTWRNARNTQRRRGGYRRRQQGGAAPVGAGGYRRVSYELKGDPAKPILEWLPQEKTWGPNFLKVDIGLYTSAASDDSFLFYVQHKRTWVNDLGAQWRNELQLGTDKLLSTSFYQPLTSGPTVLRRTQIVLQ